MKVAVVILNWNGRKFLEKFLPGVIEHSKGSAEVIVADNASSDDSLDFMAKTHPDIRVVELDKNYGFAEGYNRAFKQIDSEYYVLLNSDIEVTPGWIDPVIEMMDADKNIGAAQPKLLSYYEKDHFEYAGAAGGFIDRYGYPFCRGRIFQVLEKDEGQYDQETEIFWATGACMFVRSEIYQKMNGLDGDFFAHMEEIDFCWRMKNAGYKVMFKPGSTVFHIGGGTLPKNNAWKTYLNIRNNMIMIYKNLPTKRLWRVYIARLFLDFVAALKFFADGGFKDFWAVFQAHAHLMANFGKYRKKREKIPHIRVSKFFKGSIVKEHYLMRRKYFTELDPEKFTSKQ